MATESNDEESVASQLGARSDSQVESSSEDDDDSSAGRRLGGPPRETGLTDPATKFLTLQILAAHGVPALKDRKMLKLLGNRGQKKKDGQSVCVSARTQGGTAARTAAAAPVDVSTRAAAWSGEGGVMRLLLDKQGVSGHATLELLDGDSKRSKVLATGELHFTGRGEDAFWVTLTPAGKATAAEPPRIQLRMQAPPLQKATEPIMSMASSASVDSAEGGESSLMSAEDASQPSSKATAAATIEEGVSSAAPTAADAAALVPPLSSTTEGTAEAATQASGTSTAPATAQVDTDGAELVLAGPEGGGDESVPPANVNVEPHRDSAGHEQLEEHIAKREPPVGPAVATATPVVTPRGRAAALGENLMRRLRGGASGGSPRGGSPRGGNGHQEASEKAGGASTVGSASNAAAAATGTAAVTVAAGAPGAAGAAAAVNAAAAVPVAATAAAAGEAVVAPSSSDRAAAARGTAAPANAAAPSEPTGTETSSPDQAAAVPNETAREANTAVAAKTEPAEEQPPQTKAGEKKQKRNWRGGLTKSARGASVDLATAPARGVVSEPVVHDAEAMRRGLQEQEDSILTPRAARGAPAEVGHLPASGTAAIDHLRPEQVDQPGGAVAAAGPAAAAAGPGAGAAEETQAAAKATPLPASASPDAPAATRMDADAAAARAAAAAARHAKLRDLAAKRVAYVPPAKAQRAAAAAAEVGGREAAAASRIQSSWRGRVVRRQQRRMRRSAIVLQAAWRGFLARQGHRARVARARRAAIEESERLLRRRRRAMAQAELWLLQRLPASGLVALEQARRGVAAASIQGAWLRHRPRKPPGPAEDSGSDAEGELVLGAEEAWWRRGRAAAAAAANDASAQEEDRRAPAKILQLQQRSPTTSGCARPARRSGDAGVAASTAAALQLVDLQRRVASAAAAKERRRRSQAGSYVSGGLSAPADRGGLGGGGSYSGGGVRHKYELLLESRQQAIQAAEAAAAAGLKRAEAAERRRKRLDHFGALQELMLAPPDLSGALAPSHGSSLNQRALSGRQQSPDRSAAAWKVPTDERTARAALKAHERAVAAASGSESWWATRVPEDPQAPTVDIRTVVSPWPFPAPMKKKSRSAFQQEEANVPGLDAAAMGQHGDLEASLWWHAYARKTAVPQTTEIDGGGGVTAVKPSETAASMLERLRQGPLACSASTEADLERQRAAVQRNAEVLVQQVLRRRRNAAARAPLSAAQHARREQAANSIQARARGIAARKEAAALRAEMRVYGALQVLVSELRQPELERGIAMTIASVLADHAGATRAAAEAAVKGANAAAEVSTASLAAAARERRRRRQQQQQTQQQQQQPQQEQRAQQPPPISGKVDVAGAHPPTPLIEEQAAAENVAPSAASSKPAAAANAAEPRSEVPAGIATKAATAIQSRYRGYRARVRGFFGGGERAREDES